MSVQPDCSYMQACWGFLTSSALGIPTSLFDRSHHRCFCLQCRADRSEIMSTEVRGGVKSAIPIGWVKFAVPVSRFDTEAGVMDWPVAFHGTTAPALKTVLIDSRGQLLYFGDKLPDGTVVGARDGHYTDGRAPYVTLSPSIIYCSSAGRCKSAQFGGVSFLVAFQVHIRPESYEVLSETILNENEKRFIQIDREFRNEELEWRTDRRNVVVVTGVMVRRVGRSFVDLCSIEARMPVASEVEGSGVVLKGQIKALNQDRKRLETQLLAFKDLEQRGIEMKTEFARGLKERDDQLGELQDALRGRDSRIQQLESTLADSLRGSRSPETEATESENAPNQSHSPGGPELRPRAAAKAQADVITQEMVENAEREARLHEESQRLGKERVRERLEREKLEAQLEAMRKKPKPKRRVGRGRGRGRGCGRSGTTDADTIKVIQFEDVTQERALGKGSLGFRVFKGSFEEQPVLFRAFDESIFSTGQFNVFRFFEMELKQYAGYEHPNILKFIAYSKPPKVGVVTEYTANATLKIFFRMKSGQLSFDQKLDLVKQIAEGMRYLHEHHVVHADLRAENVFITREFTPKIDSGFNMSFQKDTSKSRYAAPELVTATEGQETSPKVDVFSFGILMYEIALENFEPYPGRSPDIGLRVSRDPNLRPSVPEMERGSVPSWYCKLCVEAWSATPDARPSFPAILAKIERSGD